MTKTFTHSYPMNNDLIRPSNKGADPGTFELTFKQGEEFDVEFDQHNTTKSLLPKYTQFIVLKDNVSYEVPFPNDLFEHVTEQDTK